MKREKEKMVRSTTHSLKLGNKAKLEWVSFFMEEYSAAMQGCVDWIWDARIEWTLHGKPMVWDRRNGCLDLPAMVSTTAVPFETKLTARALKCAATQACGIIGAVVEKRKKDLNLVRYAIDNGKRCGAAVLKRASKEMTKPTVKRINAELNSICVKVSSSEETSFDLWFELHSIFGDKRGFTLEIPLKHTKQSRKWLAAGGRLMPSVLLDRSGVSLRFEVATPTPVPEGKTVGVDQGKTTCLTLSDGQETGKDVHGHDLSSIIDKLAGKVPGSKAFRRTVAHRTNYVNWSVKRLNFGGISTVNFERITNIGFGKRVSRTLKHFTNTLIRDSLRKHCEESGVRFREVENQCNSMRCHECGWTQSSNRNGKNRKIFCCRKCGGVFDADSNASFNVEVRPELPVLTIEFLASKHHQRDGFFWNPGVPLTSAQGEVLTVPPPHKT